MELARLTPRCTFLIWNRIPHLRCVRTGTGNQLHSIENLEKGRSQSMPTMKRTEWNGQSHRFGLYFFSGDEVSPPPQPDHNVTALVYCERYEREDCRFIVETKPKELTTEKGIVLIWDMSVETGMRVPANRPDFILYDKQKKICYEINVAITDSHNSVKRYTEKIMKYQDLEIELQKCWGRKKI